MWKRFPYYRKRESASYIVREVLSVRERERARWKWETDGSAVTIAALKLAMNLHFPLPKTSHNWRWAYTFPYQKFALSVSPFTLPVSTFRLHGEVTIVALKFAMSSHFPMPKNFSPTLFSSFKLHEPRDEWSKTQDKWSNPAQSYIVLPIENMKQINTQNYWKSFFLPVYIWGEPQASPTVTCWLGFLSRYIL